MPDANIAPQSIFLKAFRHALANSDIFSFTRGIPSLKAFTRPDMILLPIS